MKLSLGNGRPFLALWSSFPRRKALNAESVDTRQRIDLRSDMDATQGAWNLEAPEGTGGRRAGAIDDEKRPNHEAACG